MSEETRDTGLADRMSEARLAAQELEAKLVAARELEARLLRELEAKSDAARKSDTKAEDRELEAKLASLTNLQDWSKWLVGINTGVLGLITFASQTFVQIIKQYNFAGFFLAAAVVSFTASLFIATCLVGSVPAFVMRLKIGELNWETENPDIEWKETQNMYEFKYGIGSLKYKLITYSYAQLTTFIIASLCLAISLVLMFVYVPAGAANAAVGH